MKAQQVIATEYLLSMGIVSWAPIKQGYYPWPPMLMRTSIAYAILSLLSIVAEEFAVLLTTGFLLAQLVKVSTGTQSIPNWIYQDMTAANDPNKGTPFTAFGLKFDGTTGVK